MNNIRLGVISFSHMHGYSYTRALLEQPGTELVGVYDESEERGKAAAEQFQTSFYNDYTQLLSKIDGVLICSDNIKHFPYAKAAAEAGVHILVEKPITTVGSEARELIDLCERKQVSLQTAFPVRLNSSVRKVKKQIEDGEIGEVVAIAATNHGKMPGGWFVDPELSGGGSVLDHTVHVADIMRWLLKSEVQEVYAEVDTLLHDIPVDDCGLLSMKFDNGVIATLDTSWSRPSTFSTWGDVTMRIVGTKGVIHLDAFAQAGSLWESDSPTTHKVVGWGDSSNGALAAEFIHSIGERRKPTISGEDGLRAAEVAWAAYESAKSGQPVQVKHY
ncbi:Gfo/Idh/MocA family protein [Paenibacillus sp. UNC451MF]|uniref:Gfo/Idh/MocA family protein n=1 Tax=Paenibacillus sp. UNC451MF TaxID=1449063 RepID=UPI000A8F5308|nr:Gfo/Idh/MocA family oxidoreductase [Paenibacillus sp. UNC451MF]